MTVSSVPDEQTGEIGGLQNTLTNLGASIGTALAGAVLISALTASFLTGIADNPDVPDSVVETAEVELAGGIPFVSDADLDDALDGRGSRCRRPRTRSSTRTPTPASTALRVSLSVLAPDRTRRPLHHAAHPDQAAGRDRARRELGAGRAADPRHEPLRGEQAVALGDQFGDFVPVGVVVDEHADDPRSPRRAEVRDGRRCSAPAAPRPTTGT